MWNAVDDGMQLSKEQLVILARFGIDEGQAESIADALQGTIGSSVGPITKDPSEKLALEEPASDPFANGGMPLDKHCRYAKLRINPDQPTRRRRSNRDFDVIASST